MVRFAHRIELTQKQRDVRERMEYIFNDVKLVHLSVKQFKFRSHTNYCTPKLGILIFALLFTFDLSENIKEN